jgi:hypothetical protein
VVAFDAEVVVEVDPNPTFGPLAAQLTKNIEEANRTSPMQTVGQTPRAFIFLRRNQSGRRSTGSARLAREALLELEVALEVVVTGIVPLPTTVIVYVPVGVVEEVVIVNVPAVVELELFAVT